MDEQRVTLTVASITSPDMLTRAIETLARAQAGLVLEGFPTLLWAGTDEDEDDE